MYYFPRQCGIRPYLFEYHMNNFMRIDKLTEGLSNYEYRKYFNMLVRINL